MVVSGSIVFEFEGNNELLSVNVLRALCGDECFPASYEPRETEEMRPAWFNIDEIPYDDMW